MHHGQSSDPLLPARYPPAAKCSRAEHWYGLAHRSLSPRKASLPRGKYLGQFKDELEMRS